MVILTCYLLGVLVGVSGTLPFLLAYINRTIRRAVDQEFEKIEPLMEEAYNKGYDLGRAHDLEARQ